MVNSYFKRLISTKRGWYAPAAAAASLLAAVLIVSAVMWSGASAVQPRSGAVVSEKQPQKPILHPALRLQPLRREVANPRTMETYKTAANVVKRQRQAELLPPKPAPAVVPPTDCRQQKCIALTFDDGPSSHTERLLDYLQQHKVKVTFFVLGVYVGKHPGIVQRMAREGHQIGNHTWHHRDLTRMPLPEVTTEIGSTNQIILQTSGVVPQVMRPPYGATNSEIITTSTMPQILWSVDPMDWKDRDAQIVTDRIVGAAERGAIVLAHDVYPTTVDAMPSVIEQLKAQGYTFATVDELLNHGQPPVPGEYRKQQL